MRRKAANLAIGAHSDVRREWRLARIEHDRVPLERVAAIAGVNEVPVIANQVLVFGARLWLEVLDAESRVAVWIPALSLKAVDAAKGKLVAQPGLVSGVIGVAAWSMLAYMRAA